VDWGELKIAMTHFLDWQERGNARGCKERVQENGVQPTRGYAAPPLICVTRRTQSNALRMSFMERSPA
jgi:hypothetical protein